MNKQKEDEIKILRIRIKARRLRVENISRSLKIEKNQLKELEEKFRNLLVKRANDEDFVHYAVDLIIKMGKQPTPELEKAIDELSEWPLRQLIVLAQRFVENRELSSIFGWHYVIANAIGNVKIKEENCL